MNKKITVMLIITILIVGTIALSKYMESLIPIQQYTQAAFDEKNKPIILWDIHGVIMKKDVPLIIKSILFFERKWEMIQTLSFGLCWDLLPVTVNALLKGSTGESFFVIAQKHDNNALAELVARVANAQDFITGTADIIKELHAHGYTQHIGSNIGTQIFEHFISKPNIKPLFNETYFDFAHSHIVTYDANNPKTTIEKPKKIFFETYLHKNMLHANQVIFIDDNRKNVATAQQLGMYALLFTDAAQLRADLWSLLGL
ncbi:MAG: HAD hydrolase-like protein [bacterium]|nr:HAD hydrolase-like protein [bacterium]